MRLWHHALIPYLPRQQLLGQHRECCALRGNGWGKKHATVDYVFRYPPAMLYNYHSLVMREMESRGYKVSEEWKYPFYRGKNCPPHVYMMRSEFLATALPAYPEHNFGYWNECLSNLYDKGHRELHTTTSLPHPVDIITLNFANMERITPRE